MEAIKNHIQQDTARKRIEDLLQVVGNENTQSNKDFIELDVLTDLVADYEERHFPVETYSDESC